MATTSETTTDKNPSSKPGTEANGTRDKDAAVKAAANAAVKKTRKFVEVTNDLPPVWEPQNDGDSLEGFYTGARSIKYRSTTFLTHVFQTEDGEMLSLSGAIADRKLARVPKGAYARVTYMGTIRTTNGDAKDWRIEVDEHTRLLEETLG